MVSTLAERSCHARLRAQPLSAGSVRAQTWPADAMKVLVIASETISADRLPAVLRGASDDAEIMVVAPALHRSALRVWLSDTDEAIRRAELVQRETVEGVRRRGIGYSR